MIQSQNKNRHFAQSKVTVLNFFDKFYKKIRGDSIKFAIIMCPRVLTIACARDKIELGEVFAIAKASLSPIVLLKE